MPFIGILLIALFAALPILMLTLTLFGWVMGVGLKEAAKIHSEFPTIKTHHWVVGPIATREEYHKAKASKIQLELEELKRRVNHPDVNPFD